MNVAASVVSFQTRVQSETDLMRLSGIEDLCMISSSPSFSFLRSRETVEKDPVKTRSRSIHFPESKLSHSSKGNGGILVSSMSLVLTSLRSRQ